MRELSPEEIALKNRFLERCKNRNWTEDQFIEVLSCYDLNAKTLIDLVDNLQNVEGFSSGVLLDLDRSLAPFAALIRKEVFDRSLSLAGFTVLSSRPVKRIVVKCLDYFLAIAFGALLMLIVLKSRVL